MSITDATAIVAIILSLINLIITLKKEVFKPKPHLNLEVKDAKIRCNGSDQTVVQMFIHLIVTPIIKYNGIKRAVLKNKQNCFWVDGNECNTLRLYSCYENIYNQDIFDRITFEKFNEQLKRWNNTCARAIEDITSNVDIPYKLTLADTFYGIRYPDGYDDFPMDNFQLIITDFLDKEYVLDIKFSDNN